MPNSYMTNTIRRTLFWVTILFFLLATPAVLLYALGYSFDWQSKKPVLTGGFYFKSIPRKAEIYLDDKLTDKTPAFIKRLLPKEYQVEITKEDYQPWRKKIRVESKKVVNVGKILLIPEEVDIETVKEKVETDFSLEEFLNQSLDNQEYFINQDNYILYRGEEQISLNPLPSGEKYEILISDDKKIAVLSQTGQLYLLNQQNKIFELIAEKIQGSQFSKDNQKLLYFSSQEIWVYDLLNQQKKLITRLSQPIKAACWHTLTDQHIIFSVNSKIKIAELDDRGQRNINDLAEESAEEIAYQLIDESIYFLQGEKLMKISF